MLVGHFLFITAHHLQHLPTIISFYKRSIIPLLDAKDGFLGLEFYMGILLMVVELESCIHLLGLLLQERILIDNCFDLSCTPGCYRVPIMNSNINNQPRESLDLSVVWSRYCLFNIS